jgi:hypothetical protein
MEAKTTTASKGENDLNHRRLERYVIAFNTWHCIAC